MVQGGCETADSNATNISLNGKSDFNYVLRQGWWLFFHLCCVGCLSARTIYRDTYGRIFMDMLDEIGTIVIFFGFCKSTSGSRIYVFSFWATLVRLFHAPQTTCGGGLRSQSASWFFSLELCSSWSYASNNFAGFGNGLAPQIRARYRLKYVSI